MNPFVKLADPETYVACPWELHVDADARTYWVDFFKRHITTVMKLGVASAVAHGGSEADARTRADACLVDFHARFDAFASAPDRFGHVTIITLDRWRDAILRAHGFVDAFLDLKNRENERMLPFLPAVCGRVDALDGRDKLISLVTGVFAGNIFDMGSEPVAKLFVDGTPDFEAVRATLKPRPWLFDDFDALADRLLAGPAYRKAVYFVDNAGSDFLLGAIPFIRHLARSGTEVVIAANERPTLNDMTIHDIRAWWPRVLETEPSLKGLPISAVSTGTGEPLIDLLDVSPELNAAAADADLVVLEGMGRGVESNLYARLTCDALNIAMIKDPAVARHAGGGLYDLVCRFR
jgi:type II pantothenate kinase